MGIRKRAEEKELLRFHVRKSLFPMWTVGQISQGGYDGFVLGGSQDLTEHSSEQPGVTWSCSCFEQEFWEKKKKASEVSSNMKVSVILCLSAK